MAQFEFKLSHYPSFLLLACCRARGTIAPMDDSQQTRKHRHTAYATETAGLLLIAFLLLMLTLLRYWHDIHWSIP